MNSYSKKQTHDRRFVPTHPADFSLRPPDVGIRVRHQRDEVRRKLHGHTGHERGAIMKVTGCRGGALSHEGLGRDAYQGKYQRRSGAVTSVQKTQVKVTREQGRDHEHRT